MNLTNQYLFNLQRNKKMILTEDGKLDPFNVTEERQHLKESDYTQKELILNHLESGNTLTGLQALNKFKCFRLASRINELRVSHNIISELVKGANGSRYAEYRLVK